MPRKARRKSRTGIYHVMLRGINRQTIFEDNEDKRQFFKTLKKYKDISKYQVFGYCLMDNHVHLLLKEPEEGLAKAIKRLSSSYVYWYNMKYDRIGHLFQERFKSENVESGTYFLTVLRYIHQNPVKAGLEKAVFKCSWTSINEYIYKARLVDIDLGLELFSPDRRKAMKLYRDYMQQTNNDRCLEDIVRYRRSDQEVREYLLELGIVNSSALQKMDKEDRDTILLKLKTIDHVSLRQLSRVTGISKSVIQRI